MNDLVGELKKARKDLIQTINEFPKAKRELVLFDEWSLKNILSHLSGWAEYQTNTLKLFNKNGKVKYQKNLKDLINVDFVSQRKKWSWEKVYREFLKLSENLIREYENIPRELWRSKIYKGKDITIEDFIKIEINHYSKTHGLQVRKALKMNT